ncbi:hypothetical protein SAMN02745163_00313 [Clostridium cavendishii DSM 21758]|uniref:Cof subfamily of IIB subfamily of haloacid dehalogenase superfamily/HAD-superfamily hydrolase, subfamily IIB n=1 Tax=Clostridium cavendishii DSM 21758 TaxID=1121302 RepID=A0A1M6BCB1_9CLOT|nr:Cof-type HAD-IIB family hydrolase [Clostridium cavendishii]SHI46345.1 hypothetical protein SAMN02745163_00313 [Clostridium cavendishii DSM 21758]
MIKFIASDMDGTLLGKDGKVSDEMFELINKLDDMGIRFAAASGRFYSQLNKNFSKVSHDMIFIAHNGAFVKYNKNGQLLYSNEISKKNIKNVLDLKRSYGEELFLSAAEKAYIVNPTDKVMEEFRDFRVEAIVLNSFNEVDEPIYKLTYYVQNGVKDEILDYLKNNLNEELEFVVSGDKWIDIMNKGVSKGEAISKLQEKLNIDEKNTMVFGDYYNDLTMFKRAHYSYAMENAPEDVKRHAKFIAESNISNGVYKAISEKCLSEEKLA